ncbi:MAG: BTAD domain-containing putative transcriptional regulator, partial [Anaerolineales bacterium]
MVPLTIRLLGSPVITVDQQPLSFRTRKVFALLIYLVVEKGLPSRESLMALLWPESSPKNAAVTLRGTLSRLRQSLQPVGESLITEAGKVGFDFRCAVDLDLLWLSATTLPEISPQELIKILEFDRGEFLTGFSLPDAPEFDRWAALQREIYQRQVEWVYNRLTQLQLANHESTTAVKTAARWVARAPFSEAPYRRLMAAQALAGDRSAALITYGQCRAMLQAEFSMEPTRETVALAENITQDQLPKGSYEGRRGSDFSHVIPPDPRNREILLPFEGRADEHSQLVAAFHQTRQDGAQVAVLIGEAGTGKTRLINAFQEWVVLESPGVEIWNGRAFETGGSLPYQPLIEALRMRLDQVN